MLEDRLELTIDVTDGDAALGLTRLELSDANGHRVELLDGLLAEVRRRIAAIYGGWVPPLGKDREANTTLAMMRGGNPKPTSILAPTEPTPEEVAQLETTSPAPAAVGAVRVGQVDTTLTDWTATAPGLMAWQGHARFVRDIVEATAPGVVVETESALKAPDGTGTTWDVATAIAKLAAAGVDILLLPLACFTTDGQIPLLLERAIAAVPESTLVIAAAGNQTLDPGWSALGRGPTSPAWPAAHPRVKAVGGNPPDLEPLAASVPIPPWLDAITTKIDFVGKFFTADVMVGEPTELDIPHADKDDAENKDKGEEDKPVVKFKGSAKWRGTSFCAAHAAGLVAARMLAEPGRSAIDAWDALLSDESSLQRPPVTELSCLPSR
ncbi:MAG: hypothetical protein QM695_02330 [Micropruina sp.]